MLKALIAVAVLATPAAALERKVSPYGVTETIDRLAAAVEEAGGKVFARIDHAAGAAQVDMELRPAEMLMFGNPRIGTPLMQQHPETGLDLPLRALAYEAEDGTVYLIYRTPAEMADAFGAPRDFQPFSMIGGVIGRLTDAAVAE